MATITGDNAANTLTGTDKADVIDGRGGDDVITGGRGADSIRGGAGNDTARFNISQDGADRVDLGSGDDTVEVTADRPGQIRLTFTSAEVGDGSARDSDTMANQDGQLAVRMQRESASGDLSGAVSRFDDEGITFRSNTAGVTFDVRDLVSGAARGDAFQVVQLGTRGNNVIDHTGDSETYYVNAGAGNDRVSGGSGDDFLVGGSGNDRLTGNRGDDTFIGGGGNDTVFGGAGDDTAIFDVTTGGRDTVNLGAGDDTVSVTSGGAGQIRLTFVSAEVGDGNANGGGSDGGPAVRLQAEDGSGALTGPVSRFDDEGITFRADTDGVTFDVRDLISGAARGDQFDEVVLGTSGADVIDKTVDETGGDDGDDDHGKGNGHDKARGRGHENHDKDGDGVDDKARGDHDDDDDGEVGGANPDNHYINGGQGDDVISGGDGDDFLVGGAGDDTLNGGNGNDTLLGGAGNDTLDGGSGEDTFIFAPGSGDDVVTDFQLFNDSLDFSGFEGIPFALSLDEDGLLVSFAEGSSVLFRIDFEQLQEDIEAFFEQHGEDHPNYDFVRAAYDEFVS